jgi:DNA (cytosine-5)-methyltransferase 1
LNQFKFIDLFAGIGGFHIAMESLGGECVFASEIDPFARKTYEANFKDKSPALFKNKMFNQDIRSISPDDLPDFDILCAGFPCQPFSQAGQKRGFKDSHQSERGNLFFNIVEILDAKKPKAFFLENVRGIVNHDDGRTFKIIREILENELGYSFHYEVIKASNYGLPQLRPRAFMIGFRDEDILSGFTFPPHLPLKFNMSDVWNGDCSREIGFTLRVGGRGSNINDRRNWDSYLVDGQVKKLMTEQAKKMQGFPESFIFPVPKTQAMKQLGNSVAVDAIRECSKALVDYLDILNKNTSRNEMTKTKNKGEWTEIYSFFKIINDKKIMLSDKNLKVNNNLDHFIVNKVSTLNIPETCYLKENGNIIVKNKNTGTEKIISTEGFLNASMLKDLASQISAKTKTFPMADIELIQEKLGISIIKGGNSDQKADILLGIKNRYFEKDNEGFGIKSYLGAKPTLLNASGATNFIYEVIGLSSDALDKVNLINTRAKYKDRIQKIKELGGRLSFHKIERETFSYNLSLVDSLLPIIVAKMLQQFYEDRTNLLSKNIEEVFRKNPDLAEDLQSLQVKLKRLLVANLLGFFPNTKWNGQNISNGTIVVKEDGDQVGFHVSDMKSLEDYLFNNIKFDTPSSRNRFGNLYLENDKRLYFKLNLQLRF